MAGQAPGSTQRTVAPAVGTTTIAPQPPGMSAGTTMMASNPGHPGHAAYLQNLKASGGVPAMPLNLAGAQQVPTMRTPTAPNINTLAAAGIQGAGQGAAAGMAYNPSQVNVAGTSASVTPTNVAGSNVNPLGLSSQVTPNQLLNANIGAYQNPYTNQVIKANETDILRGANMGLDMLGAQAQAAGGFGGSRHGVAMGEMGRGVAQQLAQSSAGLRQAGYGNAQQMALQDINNNMQGQLANQQASQFDIGTNMQGQLANQGNSMQAGLANQQAGMQGQLANQQAGMQDINNQLQAQLANQQAGLQGNQQRIGAAGQLGQTANLGFNMGQTVNNNLAMQGAQQQAMQQALMQAAQSQFQGFQNHGANGIGYVNQALGQTPNVGTVSTQETKQNGIFDYLTAMTNSYSGGA